MKNIIGSLLIMLSSFSVFAQIPEQDCINAIPVCQTIILQDQPYQGTGVIEDLADTSSCLQNEENNSVWYVFEIATAGDVEFVIEPLDTSNTVDFDFAVYDLSSNSCEDIRNGVAPEVRCNYAFTGIDGHNSYTGLLSGYINTSESSGGLPFCAPLTVAPGQRFALVIDNFSGGAPEYYLNFSTSTARFGITPRIKETRIVHCGSGEMLEVQFQNPVPCDIIKPDGSGFLITGPSAITVNGINRDGCLNGHFTQAVNLDFSGAFLNGQNYSLIFQPDTPASAQCVSVKADTLLFTPQDTTVNPTVTADFVFYVYQKQVYFINTSQGDIIGYKWMMDDGNQISQRSFIYNYSDGGAYDVCLTAIGYCSTDTICQTVYVETNEIHGYVYQDTNRNCLFNFGEEPLLGRIMKATPGPYYTMTSNGGSYTLRTGVDTFEVTQEDDFFNLLGIGQLCPPNNSGHEVIFTAPLTDTSYINFADTVPFCSLLDVNVFAFPRRVCDTSRTLIQFFNRGSAPALNAQLWVKFPDSLVLLSADSAYTVSGPNEYVFNLGDVLPGQTGRITTTDFVACHNWMGDDLCVAAWIIPANQCDASFDQLDSANSCTITRNSYDPNIKEASPEGIGNDHSILPDTEINYTIHFQNTGNDTAYDVMIWDTLSTNLSLGTFQAGAASHPYFVQITGKGKPVLVFFFNGIDLPDSTTDAPKSQGFVNFSIRPLIGLAEGIRIENTADIIFDLNPPVRTNTVFHTIAYSLSARATTSPVDFEVFPNPTSGTLIIRTNFSIRSSVNVDITDVFGKQIFREEKQRIAGQFYLNLENISQGIYLLRISNKEFSRVRKFSILR